MKRNKIAAVDGLSHYDDDSFKDALEEVIKRLLAPMEVCPCVKPRAVLLGGQSGAGKTTLHNIYDAQLESNIVVINGDECRAFHPNYLQIAETYGVDAPTYTAQWAGKMTEALIDEFSRMKYNLVIEGTLRTSEVPLKTATLLRERGYAVDLALMAVKPQISLISCQIRYEQMRIAGTIPRAVDPKHHDKIVHDIVENLGVLEASGLFDAVSLYSRSRACLYPLENETRSASEALQNVLFGPWSDEEREHYAYLEKQLAELREQS